MTEHTLSPLTRRAFLRAGSTLGLAATAASPVRLLADDASLSHADLADALRGDLILPSTPGYDDARRVWNGMIDKRPAAIARCTGVADVIEAVKYARANSLPVSVRGGGHNVAGKAVRDDALVIDLQPMRGIRVDAASKTARAEGGTRWGELDFETDAFDLVTTGGTVSTTGVAGLTLGGGLGWLMRKHGLSCDNLVGADVVTADGGFLRASADENADLFWALRGGGGNFGVVTSFDFQLHDAEPIVGGIAIWPESRLRDLLHFFREFTASAPDNVTTMGGIMVGAPDSPLAGQHTGWIAVCHSGPVDAGETLLKSIKSFGPPAVDMIAPMPYRSLQTMFDGGADPGGRNYWRSNFIEELSDEVIDALLGRASAGFPGPGPMLLLEHMGGAVGRVGAHDTAFSSRHAKYNVAILSSWQDPAEDREHIDWTRAFGDELKAFATGGAYVNYMTADESAQRIQDTYKANLEQLIEVKRKYDPANFFSGNQNIAP